MSLTNHRTAPEYAAAVANGSYRDALEVALKELEATEAKLAYTDGQVAVYKQLPEILKESLNGASAQPDVDVQPDCIDPASLFEIGYGDHVLCGLCGNSGIIDTRDATGPDGRCVGDFFWCICANGMESRAAAKGTQPTRQDLRQRRPLK